MHDENYWKYIKEIIYKENCGSIRSNYEQDTQDRVAI